MSTLPLKLMTIVLVGAVLAGCASTSKPAKRTEISEAPPVYAAKPEGAIVLKDSADVPLNIDYERLQTSLGMDRANDQLGYKEKSFATCEAGFGYPSSRNCRKDYFVSVHFRLMCRDSEGTISTPLSTEDLRPVARSQVAWTLSSAQGDLVLDSQGYGQILTTLRNSGQAQRLKLAVGNDFLYLRAGEINRVVAPGNWCP